MATPTLHRIVLTGGPCGGKSTALARITDRIRGLGQEVYCVPEAATILLGAGARPWDMTADQAFGFQAALLRLMFALEDAAASVARTSGRPSVILCDRGAMDCRAYMRPEAWSALFDEQGWSVVGLRDTRYDAVIHLVTAADGAEAHYQTVNNPMRTETPEQARERDRGVREAWIGHPRLRVIDNSTDFAAKMDRAAAAVCGLVGLPEPREVERKFLVRRAPEQGLPVRSEVVEIEQTYLLAPEGVESRARRRGQYGAFAYTHTVKSRTGPGERTEVGRMISGREYLALLAQADPRCRPVRKRRAVFLWEGRYCELDTFLEPMPGLTVLEIEVEDLREPVRLPPFLDIDREVTDEPEFSNRRIAEAGSGGSRFSG